MKAIENKINLMTSKRLEEFTRSMLKKYKYCVDHLDKANDNKILEYYQTMNAIDDILGIIFCEMNERKLERTQYFIDRYNELENKRYGK